MKTDCLLDTRAELTCLPLKYKRHISMGDRLITAQGASGGNIKLQQTKPTRIHLGPHEVTTQIWVELLQQALLGMDILIQLNSSLDFKVTWSINPLKKKDWTNHPIWA